MNMPLKVIALSDLHGFLPPVPECDLCLIAGDICPAIDHGLAFQESWLETNFAAYLDSIPARQIVGVAGNHDLIFQEKPHRVPKNMRWTYLQDDWTAFEGLKVYGTPWQPYFFDWAFNLYEPDLKERWAAIPDDTDILVLHGPPAGFGDLNSEGEHTGSPSLTERIGQLANLKLAVFGHIHEARGVWDHDGKVLANVSVVDLAYRNVHEPMAFDLTVAGG